tara:strand:+ start:3603 stop:4526 length:924 start_codon:yes stop_codon:yes gene_type:complete
MNKIIIKVSLIILFLTIFKTVEVSAINTKILFKINNEIITNIDLENEKKFLLFLNPNLNNLSNKQIENISQNSLQNRKIKEIELNKFFDLKQDNLGDVYIDNFILNSNFKNKEILQKELKKFKLQFAYFEKNLIIDNIWREFIFKKFKSRIKINKEKLKSQIENQKNEVEELNLSEILFEIKPNITIEELTKQIFSEIDRSGFEAAASIFSISSTKNIGGNLGWIKSNQISERIYSEIKKEVKITSPIKTNNGYLIIKINERRKINEKINFEEEFKKLVNIESEKEINKLGYIYFNKIKKKTFISEN